MRSPLTPYSMVQSLTPRPAFRRFSLAVALALYVLVPRLALAQSGTLDPHFGTDGIITFPFTVTSVEATPDNKILVGGASFDSHHLPASGALLARVGPDGLLDTSFGVNGIAEIPLSAADGVLDILLLADGYIIVTGYGSPRPLSSDGLLAARLLPNGQLDTTFGTDGLAFAPFPVDYDTDPDSIVYVITSFVDLQADGSLIVGSGESEIIARFTPDGAHDTTFGTNGFIVGDLFKAASRPVVQPSRGILTYRDGKLVRYTPDGQLDPSWGEGARSALPAAAVG